MERLWRVREEGEGEGAVWSSRRRGRKGMDAERVEGREQCGKAEGER